MLSKKLDDFLSRPFKYMDNVILYIYLKIG